MLVLDDAHVPRSAAARDTIASIATHLPDEITVALASRTELPLPVARLRAEGLVTELRHADLAMTRSEAATLLRLAGLQLVRDDVDALLRSTEGWPAGLSLAALSLADQPVAGPGGRALRRPRPAGRRVPARRGARRARAGRAAVRAANLDPGRADRASVRRGPRTPRLGRARSRGCCAAGFPLVALDRTAERYRHHRLLGDLLRAELRRTEPELEAALHRRASAWHASVGDRERGLRHALAADELERAGDLVWDGVAATIEQGSSATWSTG